MYAIIGLFQDGNVNRALKPIFENNDYLKLISSTFVKGSKEINKVVQVLLRNYLNNTILSNLFEHF